MKTVSYQGVTGAFSHLTAVREFGEENHCLGLATFEEVFESVEQSHADYAVLPIENSLIGSIYENYDLLNRYDMKIVGEHYTKIEQCLLGLPGAKLADIRYVLSHPKALAQCLRFLKQHEWIKAIAYEDTAAAAKEVAERGDPAYAAIASENAGKIYGLELLEKSIEDNSMNYTRFVVVSKQAPKNVVADKCSLEINLRHASGTLASVLNRLAIMGVNLTKIESRPILGSPFEYVFYIDLEFEETKGQLIENVFNGLSTYVQRLKILGLYKRGNLWTR